MLACNGAQGFSSANGVIFLDGFRRACNQLAMVLNHLRSKDKFIMLEHTIGMIQQQGRINGGSKVADLKVEVSAIGASGIASKTNYLTGLNIITRNDLAGREVGVKCLEPIGMPDYYYIAIRGVVL